VFEELYKGLENSVVYQNGSPQVRSQMEKFVAAANTFAQPFEWHGAEDAPVRANHCSYHAEASRPFRVSEGPELWSQGPIVFVPQASPEKAPGTPPPHPGPSGLLQFGGNK
jgi:hypothetical protein